jgi:DNA-binding response OmpR family regulator
MSNRTLVELNHDFRSDRNDAELLEWAHRMHAYMRSGDPDYLPYGVTFLNRRHHSEPCPAAHLVRLGPLELRLDIKRAKWRGTEVGLSTTEFAIVALLAKRQGDDVEHRDIYALVKPDGFAAGEGADGFRANVRTFVKRIRRRFEAVDPQFSAIDVYPGFGYRWLVEPVAAAAPVAEAAHV